MTRSLPRTEAGGVTIAPRALRIAGWSLVAYGLTGLLLLVLALVIGTGPVTSAEELLASLDGTLQAAADTARSSSTALRSVDAGMHQAEAGTRDAATLVGSAAATSGQLADAMGLTILGTQPLAGLADDFRTIGTQLSSLGTSLSTVGDALATSTTDLAAVRDDVEQLAVEVELARARTGPGSGFGAGSLRLAYLAMLAWLVLPAIGALALGVGLLRAERGVRISPPAA
jgi:hypothetical protein